MPCRSVRALPDPVLYARTAAVARARAVTAAGRPQRGGSDGAVRTGRFGRGGSDGAVRTGRFGRAVRTGRVRTGRFGRGVGGSDGAVRTGRFGRGGSDGAVRTGRVRTGRFGRGGSDGAVRTGGSDGAVRTGRSDGAVRTGRFGRGGSDGAVRTGRGARRLLALRLYLARRHPMPRCAFLRGLTRRRRRPARFGATGRQGPRRGACTKPAPRSNRATRRPDCPASSRTPPAWPQRHGGRWPRARATRRSPLGSRWGHCSPWRASPPP
jgi:hypothetical protein